MPDQKKFFIAIVTGVIQSLIIALPLHPIALLINVIALFLTLQAVAYYNGKDTVAMKYLLDRERIKVEAYKEIEDYITSNVFRSEENARSAKILRFVRRNKPDL